MFKENNKFEENRKRNGKRKRRIPREEVGVAPLSDNGSEACNISREREKGEKDRKFLPPDHIDEEGHEAREKDGDEAVEVDLCPYRKT